MSEQKNYSAGLYGNENLQELLFDTILKLSSEAIVITNENDEIIAWNAAAEMLFGYSTVEAVGQALSLIFTGEALQRLKSEKCIERIFCKAKDGSTIPVWARVGRASEHDKRSAYCYIIHDLRDRLKHEEAIKEKDRSMESFTYSVSHDLRAPLRRIINYAQILSEDHLSSLDEEVARLISRMAKNAEKMSDLMDDILSYSRLSQQPVKKSMVNIGTLVENIAHEFKKNADASRTTFALKPLENIVADPNMIKRAFENIIQNAVKFTSNQEHPQIEVGCEVHRDTVHYYVKDNGVGFDPQYSHKLFTIFQRLHTPAEYEGNGIGLALVQQIIWRHGGKVWAEGKVNEGAAFWFSLPK